MKRTPFNCSVLSVAGLLMTGGLYGQSLLFHDDFSNVTSGLTPVSDRSAQVGTWSAPDGGPNITGAIGGGYVETLGGRRVIDAQMTRAVQSGEYLTITWNTLESSGNFGAGHAGITLYQGGAGVGFFGSPSSDAVNWMLAQNLNGASAVSTGVNAEQSREAGKATLVYSYDTGLATLRVVGGSGQAQIGTTTLNLGANLSIDRLQIENNGGADLRFTGLSANVKSFQPFRWNVDANGTWGDSGNWSSNLVANGVDHVAIFSDVNYTSNRTITVDGTRTVGELIVGDQNTGSAGVVTFSGGTISLQNTLGKPLIQADNTSTNITSQVSGNQGFIKTGIGTLTLNNNNNASTLSGSIQVKQGILGISNDLVLGAIPSSFQADAIVLDGGTLANMTNATSGELAQFSSGHSVTINANRGITLGGNNGTFRVGYHTSQSMAVDSVISGVGGLNKTDGANLILRGANTYQGNTSVSDGSIYVKNTSGSATGTGSVNVNNNATLGGNGIIGGGDGKLIDFRTGSILKVGDSHAGAVNGLGVSVDSAPQMLTIGLPGTNQNLGVNLNGVMQFDLFGVQSDHLDINTSGQVNLNNASLALGFISTDGWKVGQEWKLIDWTGATILNAEGLDSFSTWHNTYELAGEVRADGYYLSIIPEPSRALLFLMAPVLAAMRRRR